jgi:flagellar basal-body rod protein FlgC
MIPDRLSSTFKTAAQGLALQRERIDVASRNIANSQTTAPKGSGRAYRPQHVKTIAPEQENFLNVFANSVSGLKQTSSKHISSNMGSVEPKNGGLGPQFYVEEQERFRYEYDPTHPDADENGMVQYPDIDMVKEMTELVSANRLYEANLSSIEAEKEIIKRSMEI